MKRNKIILWFYKKLSHDYASVSVYDLFPVLKYKMPCVDTVLLIENIFGRIGNSLEKNKKDVQSYERASMQRTTSNLRVFLKN